MRLTYLSVLLAAASVAGGIGVAATGDLRLPKAVDARQGDAALPDPARIEAGIALAGEAERRGDVAAALAHYRAASLLDPRIVDPRSPVFLGPAFEARLKQWIAAQKKGGAGGSQARSDAAYLFRRMYGGCG
ncbi:MAG TPA: hypothetical protein VER06_00890 [Candidatus Methanoperedens sp.]|nr:hypothetical protein [Candidatus Methanoperedens sp.]